MIRIQLPDGSHADFDTTDPRAAARAAQRVVALKASQAKRPDNPISDFSNQVGRSLGVGDDLAGVAGYTVQGIENLANRVQGKPIDLSAADAGLASAAYDRQRGEEYAQQKPIANAAASFGGLALAGKPGVGPNMTPLAMPRTNPFVAGGQAAGLVAPFAVAQQEGTLPERAVKAVPGIALGGIFGAGMQSLGNALGDMASNSQVAKRALEFEKAAVRPTMAALMSGEASLAPGITKAIAENFWAGGNARRNLQSSIADTAAGVQRMAEKFGRPSSPLIAGEKVMSGVQSFAGRQGSFRTKAGQLFDEGLRPVAQAPANTSSTEQVLQQIIGPTNGLASQKTLVPKKLQDISEQIIADKGKLNIQNIRDWRSWVRQAQDDPNLSQTIDNASLQRLEAALTADIYGNAYRAGGPSALQKLRQADRYYAAGMQRIQKALQPFADPRMHGSSAYDRIIQLASEKGNTRALTSLKRSLSNDDWNTVSATILSRMGNPKPSSPDALADGAFNVESFVTNYARMSPEGRRAIFGALGGGGAQAERLASELDNLARVASYQKQIEAMANRSHSGMSVQNVTVSPFNPVAWPILVGATITGDAMTNPAFVRWLASAPRAAGEPGGMTAHLQQLAVLASRDPAIAKAEASIRAEVAKSGLFTPTPMRGGRPASIPDIPDMPPPRGRPASVPAPPKQKKSIFDR